MLPGLMSLTRIECLRWDGNGDRTGGSCFGGRRRDPSERRAPPTTCCCQSLGSQISALTISSRGSGWPCPCRKSHPRSSCGMLVLMKHSTESVVSSYAKAGDLIRNHQWHGQWLERAGVRDALMRPVPVVEKLELPQGVQKVGLVPDQCAVQ
jgi:hypothetical protein